MDDVERLFRHLVDVLATDDAERLRTPFQVSELYQSIIPYRSHKSELHFDAIEDYEMAILRLLAGERGYASIEPIEVRDALMLEVEAVNPNPGAFREFAAARVLLNAGAVRSVLEERKAYAPPPTQDDLGDSDDPFGEAAASAPAAPMEEGAGGAEGAEGGVGTGEETHSRVPVFEPVDVGEPTAADAATCMNCNARLPAGRKAVFCPHCGHQLQPSLCSACGDPLEPGWRFCLTCGQPVQPPHR